jgi:hypothetical protein
VRRLGAHHERPIGAERAPVQRVRDWHEIARAAQDEHGLVLRGEVDRSEREGDEARVGPAKQSREKVVQVLARERGVMARRPIKRLKRLIALQKRPTPARQK